MGDGWDLEHSAGLKTWPYGIWASNIITSRILSLVLKVCVATNSDEPLSGSFNSRSMDVLGPKC